MDFQIKKLAKEFPLPETLKPKAELLMSMPGVGQLIAAKILAEIGDIRVTTASLRVFYLGGH